MYVDDYFEAVESLLWRIRTTQIEAIKLAAEAIADSLANKGVLAVMDTGHMLRHEAFFRAGGMVAIVPFSYSLNVECPVDQRQVESSAEEQGEVEARKAALALDSSKLKNGDVLIINSNSGRTINVIEVALQCKDRGIRIIGISSVEQMLGCPAAHRSGKKLFDVADICIDNCGPHGDAMLEVKDNEKICPGSGLGATYVFWSIHAEVVERLQEKGINPTIFRSVHVSGREYVDKQRQEFLEKGI